MANFQVRISESLASRFDAWAAAQGGRSPALRRLMEAAAADPRPTDSRPAIRPVKLTVRLSAEDSRGLASAAEVMGMTPNAWAAAVIRHRLHGRPTMRPDHEVELIALRAEVRRVGVNVNQIARALNTAVIEGDVLDLELQYLDALRTELRAHIDAIGEAFAGNLAYWQAEP